MITQAVRLATALADRYRIDRELGAGGMATVYLAEDLKHDRKVAIKVLKPELAAVLGTERFVVEIKTNAAMSHPHILPLFDSGTADGFLYYVMPYIEGETIRDKLNRETQFGVDEAVRIAREAADVLDYAHRRGIMHRDIKPENILLHDERAMIMDFGIALAMSGAAARRMKNSTAVRLKIVAATVQLSPKFTVSRTPLFDDPFLRTGTFDYDVLPDGGFVKLQPDIASKLIVINNWPPAAGTAARR